MRNLSFDGFVELEGLVNARDVGGKPAGEGGRVRTGVLYRSETPQLMTPAAVARAIGELGIERVIDLRGSRGGSGSGPLGAEGRGVVLDFFELAGGLEAVVETADGFLPGLLDRGGAAVGAVLEEIVAADGATLVHCHTGKDRTGFVVAITLAMLGVGDTDIIADYERSIPVFTTMMANLLAAGLGVTGQAPAYARHPPSPAGIRELLGRLRAGWETPQAYLLAQGVDTRLLDKAREALTETAPA
jgi:hypothetical protein